MFPLFRGVMNVIRKCPLAPLSSNYHILLQPLMPNIVQNKLLTPTLYNFTPNCGFKVKGKVKRRCKDCYMVMREQRLYVLCKTHPRHKQMSMVKDPKNTWILTHATQTKVRPW